MKSKHFWLAALLYLAGFAAGALAARLPNGSLSFNAMVFLPYLRNLPSRPMIVRSTNFEPA